MYCAILAEPPLRTLLRPCLFWPNALGLPTLPNSALTRARRWNLPR
ncbi:hypothetical protein AWB68_08269 [Caballeronia choica]|jgi:hypothetical protein|uniref:Uncharacterized protein n=1 Tax=Caballeronia choica TaxID=326476 RepID=A0A158L113_9BURK|nr:hypothetical protein AWB68_08269 [Caballeronia choica]